MAENCKLGHGKKISSHFYAPGENMSVRKLNTLSAQSGYYKIQIDNAFGDIPSFYFFSSSEECIEYVCAYGQLCKEEKNNLFLILPFAKISLQEIK